MKQEFIEEQPVSWSEPRSSNQAVCETLGCGRTHRPVEHIAIPCRLSYEVESVGDELETARISIATAVRQCQPHVQGANLSTEECAVLMKVSATCTGRDASERALVADKTGRSPRWAEIMLLSPVASNVVRRVNNARGESTVRM
jgi:hypothetical protein